MTNLVEWLSGSLAESLCLALLHSLWQGAVWSGVLLVALWRIAKDRPRIRYAVALLCLYGLLGGVCLSWSIVRYRATASHEYAASAVEAGAASTTSGTIIPPARADAVSRAFGLRAARVTPWFVSAWILGAGTCLMLSSRHVAAARTLRRGTPIDDPTARRLLDRLISRLRVSRTVQLLSVQGLAAPCVVGALKPAVLIPASLVTGMTPDQWEGILAHELAHVRRWDYLVNLSQLVIESLLFFNPAVWWLSRQVNLEREACCDASAVEMTARPVQYATLLVGLAERLQLRPGTETPAVGFSRDEAGSLMERVHRIVTPGRRSELRIKPPAAVSFLVLGLIAVGLLQVGADVAVAVAAEMLSDEERVETLVESAEEVRPRESDEEVTIRGTIEVEGDEPLEHPVTIGATTRRGIHVIGSTIGTVDLTESRDLPQIREFEATVGPGVTWLQFSQPECAEILAGPFGTDGRTLVSDVRVVLARGIDVSVTIVDEKGSPVPEARIHAYPVISGTTYRKHPTTDAHGRAVLEHVNPALEYGIWITAPGFQRANPPAQRFARQSTPRFEMLRATPASGLILDWRGEPVAGAKVKQIRRRRPMVTEDTPLSAGLLAVTDAEGRFRLGELEDGWTYDLLVEADDCAPTIVPKLRPGDEDVRVEVGPALAIEGAILGSNDQLEELKRRRAIVWRLRFPMRGQDRSLGQLEMGGRLEFEIVGGVGRFTMPPMAPGELVLQIGESFVRRELTESIADLRIELTDEGAFASPDLPTKRPIRVCFVRDKERVSPRGTLQVFNRRLEKRHKEQSLHPIEGGMVEALVYAPDRLQFDCRGMIGFWFASHDAMPEIVAGEATVEIEVPVRPAGAVKGVVLNGDGTPVEKAHVSVTYELDYRVGSGWRSFGGGCDSKVNQKGEFFVSPIPFGADCSIRASRGKDVAVGGEFRMSAENALPSFTLKLSTAVDARTRPLDPAGAPLVVSGPNGN